MPRCFICAPAAYSIANSTSAIITVLPRSGCLRIITAIGATIEKRRQRTLLEEPHTLLALAQKIREEKHQREFRELHRLADVGTEPEPSARAAAHDSQMGNIEQQQHRDGDDQEWNHQASQPAQGKLRQHHQHREADTQMEQMQLEKMKGVAGFFLAHEIGGVETERAP